jgi:hypothetical protein
MLDAGEETLPATDPIATDGTPAPGMPAMPAGVPGAAPAGANSP